jgi:hypothetical protein
MAASTFIKTPHFILADDLDTAGPLFGRKHALAMAEGLVEKSKKGEPIGLHS